MKTLFKTLLLAVTTLIASGVAYAQVTTSSLGGKITDEKGETVIGAAVIATHTPSGTTYGAVTNVDGRYYITGMRAGGPYTIEPCSWVSRPPSMLGWPKLPSSSPRLWS